MKKCYRRAFTLLELCTAIFFAACGKDANADNKNVGGASQKLDSEGLSQAQIDNAQEVNGNAFENLSVVGIEDSVYCNLPENMTAWEDIIPICHDPLYDILYYVDYGGDYMIHMVKDGEEKLAASVSGRRLFCRGGKLYFLMDTFGEVAVKDVKSGNILSYDPISGNVDLVSDLVFDSMIVFQDMIFCKKKDASAEDANTEKNDYYFYFFETGEFIPQETEPVPTYLLGIQRYGDFFLSGVLEQVDLSSLEDESLKKLFESYIEAGVPPERIRTEDSMMLCQWDGSCRTPLNGLSLSSLWRHYAKGDNILWFSQDGLLHTYHIPTQQEETCPILFDGGSAILLNNQLYAASGSYNDFEKGMQEKCFVMDSTGNKAVLTELYTDGKSVYGIASSGNANGKLYCIRVADRKEAAEIASSYVLEELGSYPYAFILSPIDTIWQ